MAIPSATIRGRIERPQISQWRQSQMGTTSIFDREPSGEHGAAGIARQQEIATDALKEAHRLGASSAECAVSSSAGFGVNVRMGEVETIEHTRDKALGVSVYIGHKKGSASTTDFSSQAVNECVAAACGIARHTAEDAYAGLADAELMATDFPDLDLHHPWDIGPEAAIAIALETEAAARSLDSRIVNSEGAGVSRLEGIQVYANSHGFNAGYASSRHSISCAVIAGDDDGMQRDSWYSLSRDPGQLEDAPDIGRRAAERSLRRLGARRISTRSVPVLFAAQIATGLLGHFVNAVRGGNLYRKASFLVDALGKSVFPNHVRVHEQPHLPGAVGSSAYDSEGVATTDRDLVIDGVLQGYVLSSYSARKLGMQTTANAGGVHNLTAEPSPREAGLDELLATMEKGLYVTELMGMGVNTVTGDYSRGAAGFWVEAGAIQYPVEEFTIAGNLRDMFLGIQAIGAEQERRGNIRTGSVLIDTMTVAGA
jgi:PmbA protein